MNIRIDYVKCGDCRTYTCVDCCAMAVFSLKDNKPVVVDLDSCTLCGICEDLCPKKAITLERSLQGSGFQNSFFMNAKKGECFL